MRLAAPLILRPLGVPSLALLWGGLATSAIGDQLFIVVLSWIAVGVFGTAASYLTSLQAATTLLVALTVGHWADRRDDRLMMMTADIGRAAVLLLAIVLWMGSGGPVGWTLFLCVITLAGGQALFRPALQATLPSLLDDVAMLPAANGLLDTTERIARLLGPGLIGLVSAFVPLVHFVTLDALTFLVSASAIRTIMRLRPAPAHIGASRGGVLEGLVRGFRTTRRHPLLWFQLMTTGLNNGAWFVAYFVGVPLLLAEQGIGGPGGGGLAAFGLVISSYGLTNLAATLVVGNRGVARRPHRLIFAGIGFVGLGMAALGAAPLLVSPGFMLPVLCLCAGFSAIGGPMQDITTATLRQLELPKADLAASVRAYIVMNNLGLLISLLVAPTVFDTIGIPATIVLCGAGELLIPVLGVRRFGLR
ncbi:MAG TPA: MFS transporter [Acetobacteraceae bacterium]|nr:MFS transporter [Acetobacteraceae bacterium]